MKFGLQARIKPELLDKFQIFVSRIEEPLDPSKIRIYWAHDLPGDPGADFLHNGGWKSFHKLVFASNWQMQGFIQTYNIPWSMCVVLRNCIDPITNLYKPKHTMRLVYWATPHRGLVLFPPVLDAINAKYGDRVKVDIFSSFELYGWKERDEYFRELFQKLESHPLVTMHGTVDNNTLRNHLASSHIMAYPSIWQETSCICLMEAMSAGMIAVHPNYGALYETGANWTFMYQWTEDPEQHVNMFAATLFDAIDHFWDESVQGQLQAQKVYADAFYNWEGRARQWEQLLLNLVHTVGNQTSLPKAPNEPMFVFSTLD